MKRPILIGENELHRWFGKRVLERDYDLPDGTTDKFYVFGGTTLVIVFPLTRKEKVVAVEQFRYGVNEFVLEIPGGNIKGTESPEETARNELLEETGYLSDEIHLLGRKIYLDPASFDASFFPALALDCRRVKKPHREKTEVMKTVLVPLDKWIEMIFFGEIRDAKTLAVSLLALEFLNKIKAI